MLKSAITNPYCDGAEIQKPKVLPLYELRNTKTKDHMVTTDEKEKDRLKKQDYNYERIEGYVFKKKQPGTVPLYSYYNKTMNDHFATTHFKFRKSAYKFGYDYEGMLGYIYNTEYPGTIPLYQFFSEVRQDHLVTTDEEFLKYTQQFGGYLYQTIEGYILKTAEVDK